MKKITQLTRTNFWHYTTADSLKAILGTQSFLLGQLSSMNDRNEAVRLGNRAQNIYATCFCNTTVERVSMWLLYSGMDNGVALGIKPSVMDRILSQLNVIGLKDKTDNDGVELVENTDFVFRSDWIYYQGQSGRSKYRNKVANYQINSSNHFIKDYAWESEYEYRIALEIINPDYMNHFNYLKISFDNELIEKMIVRIGPTTHAKAKSKLRKDFNRLGINFNNIMDSHLEYDFEICSKNREQFLGFLKKLAKNPIQNQNYLNEVRKII